MATMVQARHLSFLALSGILQCEGIKKMSQDQIGYVGHKNALNETETVREYLYFGRIFFLTKMTTIIL